MAIAKFGQYVLLEVHDESGALVFSTDNLKIDFDIRHITGWSRAKFTITNLAPDTIRKISYGENYLTLKVKLHDGPEHIIADRMFISNALEEVKVPESIFNMYCYSKLRRKFLEEQINVKIDSPSLRRVIQGCLEAAKYKGSVEFVHFPEGMLDYVPPSPNQIHRGSLITCLKRIGAKGNYRFNVYTVGNKFVLMYKPEAKNVESTSLFDGEGNIKLKTNNMRSNPKIGPATLSVISNLDPNIKPATVLDISQLLTVGTNTDQKTLEVAEEYLFEKIAGFSKYQVLSVQHKGSNWDSNWMTQAAATSPTHGTNMPTGKWWE